MPLESLDNWLTEDDEAPLWELFHENSKTSTHERHPTFATWPSDATIVRAMRRLRQVKLYRDRPKVELPRGAQPRKAALDELMRARRSARAFSGAPIDISQLGAVLTLSYGVSRDNEDTHYPRPFRMVPSGGALFPLELYVYAADVGGLERGLFHFDPIDLTLDVLRTEDCWPELRGIFVQRELAARAAAVLFISAVFYRSTFKYGDRGYRFLLLEAGHLAQNANLVAQALGLATVNVGGYLDREADRFLGFDGLSESTIYLLLLGHGGDEG